jgi:hypothetical protein
MTGSVIPRWLILLLVLGTLVYCAIEATGEGDFAIYMLAAGDLSDQADIYAKTYYDGYHYYYSVFFALLLKPFYTLPFYAVKLVWLLLNALLAVHLFRLLSQSEIVRNLATRQQQLLLGTTFLFSLRFLHENLHASQVTILILWCCVQSLRLSDKGRPGVAGLLLAFGISIKMLPLVLVPYLLYRRKVHTVIYATGFYLAMMWVPSIIIGHTYNLFLIKSWWALLNPVQTQHVLDVDERSFHGLSTLLSTLLVEHPPDPRAMALKRNIADVPLDQLFIILQVARAVLVLFTLYFVRSLPFRNAKTAIQSMAERAYILLLVPLIFPHQQHYAFLFAAPAFAFIVYAAITLRANKMTWLLIGLVYLVANLKLLLGEFNAYYEHYKILTYGALLLLPLLAVSYARLRDSEAAGSVPPAPRTSP